MDVNLSFIKDSHSSEKLEAYLNQLFKVAKEIKGVLLFGSLARGNIIVTNDTISDIDLLVIFLDNYLPINHNKRTKFMIKTMGLTNIGFDSMWITETEFKSAIKIKIDIVLSALNEGIILYDPFKIISEHKDALFKELKNKGVIKRKNYWMWPLKYLGEEIEW